jgi:hypothetical protein
MTWSCYGRGPPLGAVARRDLVLAVLERMRDFWSKLPARGRSSALIGILRVRGPLASPMSRFAQDDNF